MSADGDGQNDLRLVLVGPPGAGKGTQASRLSADYGVPHIATGEMLRENVREETELGKKAKRYMDRGELVPDELIIEMVRERLTGSDSDSGFILDGFPRTVPQAEALEQLLDELEKPLQLVLRMAIDEDEVLRRITGRRVCEDCGETYHVEMDPPRQEGVCDECGGRLVQREDDSEEIVRERLDAYREQTEGVVSFYEERGLLHHVDAEGEVDAVTDRMHDVLAEYAERN